MSDDVDLGPQNYGILAVYSGAMETVSPPRIRHQIDSQFYVLYPVTIIGLASTLW